MQAGAARVLLRPLPLPLRPYHHHQKGSNNKYLVVVCGENYIYVISKVHAHIQQHTLFPHRFTHSELCLFDFQTLFLFIFIYFILFIFLQKKHPLQPFRSIDQKTLMTPSEKWNCASCCCLNWTWRRAPPHPHGRRRRLRRLLLIFLHQRKQSGY